MPVSFTAAYKKELLATSGKPLLTLLEINQSDLETPIRVVLDNQDVTAQGNVFSACYFDIVKPDDVAGQIPSAQLTIDNIDQQLIAWLEDSNGGPGTTVRIIAIRRDDPDVFEQDITLDMTAIAVDQLHVTGTLGFVNTLGAVAVTKIFSPTTSPGIY